MNDITDKSNNPQSATQDADQERMAAYAKALGHPARLRIMQFLLAQSGCMCGDIVEHIDLAQSTVSQHLKMLKEAGLIQGTIEGTKRCYCVDPTALQDFSTFVNGLQAQAPCTDLDCCDC